MRTIEEIKADIASCDGAWIDSLRCRSLRCELYETILGDISIDRLEQICAAEKDGRCVVHPEGEAVWIIESYAKNGTERLGIQPLSGKRVAEYPIAGFKDEDTVLIDAGFMGLLRPVAGKGRVWFLDRAEAEKALGKEQGHDD